jgi:hypothetical protein
MKVNTAGLFSLSHAASAQAVDDLDMDGEIEVVEVEGPPAPPSAAAVTAQPPRIRKTTLEHFNEEMSVLDRPLEGEVEFYDEPKPRRWRVPAIGGVIFLASCAAYLGVLRHRSTAEAAPAPAPAPAVATAPAAATPPGAAAVPAATAPTVAPAAAVANEAPNAPPAVAPAASADAPVVADASGAGAHHHHHGRHASASGSAHHHHHGGHGHHGRA